MTKAAVLTALALLALGVFAACGDSTGQTPSPTVEPTATAPPGGGGGGGEATVVPIATPFPTPPPVPEDWANYSDPDGRFTVRYPPTWFLRDSRTFELRQPGEVTAVFSTFELGTVGPQFPPNSIKVDVESYPAIGASDCGPQSVDPQSGEGAPRSGAAPATLGGVSGWQAVTLFDPSTSNGVTRSHGISVIYKGQCFLVVAYFAQDNPDEVTFSQIVDSFKFTD